LHASQSIIPRTTTQQRFWTANCRFRSTVPPWSAISAPIERLFQTVWLLIDYGVQNPPRHGFSSLSTRTQMLIIDFHFDFRCFSHKLRVFDFGKRYFFFCSAANLPKFVDQMRAYNASV
jgi:hypothetical protein